MRLKPTQPVFGIRTPLGEVPRWWLDNVEKDIIRPRNTSCWLWVGPTMSDGEPCRYMPDPDKGGKSTETPIKRLIVQNLYDGVFWQYIYHACENTNCVNPEHLYVTCAHPNNTGVKEEIARLAAGIRRYGVRKNA